MHILIGVALGLILAGIFMAWKHDAIRQPLLAQVVYFAGVVLVVVGLVLLLTPVLIFVNAQLRSAFNL